MSIYLYELPTTGAISFSDFCSDRDASYASCISEATQARANLRLALKESKRADHAEKDFLGLVKVHLTVHWTDHISISFICVLLIDSR